jgi:hypothetical protein
MAKAKKKKQYTEADLKVFDNPFSAEIERLKR